MKTQQKPALHRAKILFMKPKRLLPPEGRETACDGRSRLLAEAVHGYLSDYRPNHWRSLRNLGTRIDEFRKSLKSHESVTPFSEKEFLSAVKAERHRRWVMCERITSITPEGVEQIVLDLDERMPGRVVRLRAAEA